MASQLDDGGWTVSRNVFVETCDGHRLSVYEAVPSKPNGAGLVLLQEIFGLNQHIRSLCDRYGKQGFHVVAPALFDRIQPRLELGYSAEELRHGRSIRLQIPWGHIVQDVRAACSLLSDCNRRGIIGYCWGGSVAWLSAARIDDFATAVVYYGPQIVPELLHERPHCPVLMHFADDDPWVPTTDIEKIRGVGYRDVQICVYHASHGFNCDARDNYHSPSARLAAQRTLEFLMQPECRIVAPR